MEGFLSEGLLSSLGKIASGGTKGNNLKLLGQGLAQQLETISKRNNYPKKKK